MKQFHTFRLDTVNHCLWRGEERVSLTPKAFDVLRYLVEHAGRLVTQDEILAALWPETYVNPEVIKKYRNSQSPGRSARQSRIHRNLSAEGIPVRRAVE